MKTLEIDDQVRAGVLEALAGTPWFQALQEKGEDHTLLDKVVAAATLHEYGSGEHVVRQDEVSNAFFVLIQGRVSVLISRGDETAELGQLDAPRTFGEAGIFLGEPRTASVVAMTTARVLRFSAGAFRSMFDVVPGFGFEVARHLSRRLKELSALVIP